MKAPDKSKNQSGFFDLGISLLVLAIAGGSIYLIEHPHTEKTAARLESTTLTADLQTEKANEVIARREPETPGLAAH